MEVPVICVTPAGRKRYLELLKHYVLRDETIREWHLWDNCRSEQDRSYINELAREHAKIRIFKADGADGTAYSVSRFYPLCDERETFYIKMDDDLVYLPENFGAKLYEQAHSERGRYIWWSPLIVNNAICSWILKHHSRVDVPEQVCCQAFDERGWFDPRFAELMHQRFLSAVARGETQNFCVPNFEVSLSRFSINCIGFFGSDVVELGERFCPKGVDDEEWISAVLPSLVGRPGRIVGSLAVAHFSFGTQEPELLRSGLLDRYYRLANLEPAAYAVKGRPLKQRLFLLARAVKRWEFGQIGQCSPDITQVSTRAPMPGRPSQEGGR